MLSISTDWKNYSPSASHPFLCSCYHGNAGCLVCYSHDKRKVPVSCCVLHTFRKVIVCVKQRTFIAKFIYWFFLSKRILRIWVFSKPSNYMLIFFIKGQKVQYTEKYWTRKTTLPGFLMESWWQVGCHLNWSVGPVVNGRCLMYKLQK